MSVRGCQAERNPLMIKSSVFQMLIIFFSRYFHLKSLRGKILPKIASISCAFLDWDTWNDLFLILTCSLAIHTVRTHKMETMFSKQPAKCQLTLMKAPLKLIEVSYLRVPFLKKKSVSLRCLKKWFLYKMQCF